MMLVDCGLGKTILFVVKSGKIPELPPPPRPRPLTVLLYTSKWSSYRDNTKYIQIYRNRTISMFEIIHRNNCSVKSCNIQISKIQGENKVRPHKINL